MYYVLPMIHRSLRCTLYTNVHAINEKKKQNKGKCNNTDVESGVIDTWTINLFSNLRRYITSFSSFFQILYKYKSHVTCFERCIIILLFTAGISHSCKFFFFYYFMKRNELLQPVHDVLSANWLDVTTNCSQSSFLVNLFFFFLVSYSPND